MITSLLFDPRRESLRFTLESEQKVYLIRTRAQNRALLPFVIKKNQKRGAVWYACAEIIYIYICVFRLEKKVLQTKILVWRKENYNHRIVPVNEILIGDRVSRWWPLFFPVSTVSNYEFLRAQKSFFPILGLRHAMHVDVFVLFTWKTHVASSSSSRMPRRVCVWTCPIYSEEKYFFVHAIIFIMIIVFLSPYLVTSILVCSTFFSNRSTHTHIYIYNFCTRVSNGTALLVLFDNERQERAVLRPCSN
jgi:hypothetical protein